VCNLGLSENAIFIHSKNHNMCMQCDVFIKSNDPFQLQEQDN
jgi:hypothetical protein